MTSTKGFGTTADFVNTLLLLISNVIKRVPVWRVETWSCALSAQFRSESGTQRVVLMWTSMLEVPRCIVPVEDGGLVVFSNYSSVYRVLRMVRNPGESNTCSRDFLAFFVIDQRHPPAEAERQANANGRANLKQEKMQQRTEIGANQQYTTHIQHLQHAVEAERERLADHKSSIDAIIISLNTEQKAELNQQ